MSRVQLSPIQGRIAALALIIAGGCIVQGGLNTNTTFLTVIGFAVIALGTWSFLKVVQADHFSERAGPLSQHATSFVTVDENIDALPKIQGEWRSIAADHEALFSYAKQLDGQRNRAEAAANRAIAQFEADVQHVESQRTLVLYLAKQARPLLKRFKELPSISTPRGCLQPEKFIAPALPKFLTPQQYASQYALVPNNAGAALAKIFTTGGLNAQNAVMAIAAVGVMAIRAKQTISKSVRALEDARGKLSALCVHSNTTIALLRESHLQLVSFSRQLKEVEDELTQLMEQVKAIPPNHVRLVQLTNEDVATVKTLWFWILSASQAAKRAPA